jgi:hypothetical protein
MVLPVHGFQLGAHIPGVPIFWLPQLRILLANLPGNISCFLLQVIVWPSGLLL